MAWIGTSIVAILGIGAMCVIARFTVWPFIKSICKFFTRL